MKSSHAQASALPLTGFRGWLAELESPAFLWSFLYFFLLLTAYYVLRPVRDALGSTQNLQWLFSGTFVVMLLLQPIYGALVSRFPRRVFLPVVYAVFIACLGFFYWAFPFWLGLLWAFLNVNVLGSCSGDTCIGYSLPAFPFPFLYGIGELVLLSERQPRADR